VAFEVFYFGVNVCHVDIWRRNSLSLPFFIFDGPVVGSVEIFGCVAGSAAGWIDYEGGWGWLAGFVGGNGRMVVFWYLYFYTLLRFQPSELELVYNEIQGLQEQLSLD
jgi:hypothetical protein